VARRRATNYVLKRGVAPGGPMNDRRHPGQLHVDLLLTNDTTYYYTPAARNAGGESAPRRSLATRRPSSAEVEAVPATTARRLRWRPPVPTAERYRVMRSSTSSDPIPIAHPAETDFSPRRLQRHDVLLRGPRDQRGRQRPSP
jgi:hypothetical protein